MKKLLNFMLIISLLIIFSGCNMYNFHHGKRPIDFPDTKWVSDDPDVWFEVDGSTDSSELYGKMLENGEYIDIVVSWDSGGAISIYRADIKEGIEYGEYYNWLLYGSCKFTPERLIVETYKKNKHANNYKDLIFNYQYDEITFIKENIEQNKTS